MRSKPHLRRFYNSAYNPFETKYDLRATCTVCGFKGIDAVATQEPEMQSFGTVTTGSVYQIPVGTPADKLSSAIDKDVFTQEGTFAGCPFCGSPNWSWARESGLQW